MLIIKRYRRNTERPTHSGDSEVQIVGMNSNATVWQVGKCLETQNNISTDALRKIMMKLLFTFCAVTHHNVSVYNEFSIIMNFMHTEN